MNDNQVWQILTATFNQALTDANFATVKFARSYQPRQEGAISSDALYCHKISSKRYGWQKHADVFNAGDDDFDHTESQIIEAVYQVSAEVSEDPSDINQITSFDIVHGVALQLNSLAVRKALKVGGIGIIRITDVRTPYFVNDSDRNEAEPNFDFTINYTITQASKVEPVTEFQENINRV